VFLRISSGVCLKQAPDFFWPVLPTPGVASTVQKRTIPSHPTGRYRQEAAALASQSASPFYDQDGVMPAVLLLSLSNECARWH
jgi:hypothetical protein